jgi:hypothetical protein
LSLARQLKSELRWLRRKSERGIAVRQELFDGALNFPIWRSWCKNVESLMHGALRGK